jgi:hypothetical protein
MFIEHSFYETTIGEESKVCKKKMIILHYKKQTHAFIHGHSYGRF